MGVRRVGFEGKLYYGTAGSTAATEVTIARDVNYAFTSVKADVSDRASIIEYSRTAMVGFSLDFEVNNDATNAFVAALRTAAAGGTALAFKTLDRSAGYGCDGDFIIDLGEGQPLKDKQSLRVTCTPTNDNRAITWS